MSSDSQFSELAGRLREQRQSAQPIPETDFESIYLLRRRILGVLIQDARIARGKSVAACAEAVGVSPAMFSRYEHGEEALSLPQLELLAYLLDLPIRHFWGTQTLEASRPAREVPDGDFRLLRDRIIGVQLRRARTEAQLSLEALAARVGIAHERIERYEFGLEPIPFVELVSLASAVNVGLDYFLEDTSTVGARLLLEEDSKLFAEMPLELRRFAVQPVNRSYIEVAMRLSRLSVEELRGIAEGILNITY